MERFSFLAREVPQYRILGMSNIHILILVTGMGLIAHRCLRRAYVCMLPRIVKYHID
jgi:hypothetical protein